LTILGYYHDNLTGKRYTTAKNSHLPDDKKVLFALPRATIATPTGIKKAAFPKIFFPQT